MTSKITDGDFIVMQIDENTDRQVSDLLQKEFMTWLKSRGLNNCKVMIARIPIKFAVCSVNDPMNEVLK